MTMLKAYSRTSVETTGQSILRTFFVLTHKVIRGSANRLLNGKYIKPRKFSNDILRHYAPIFTGDIINVSGWKDEDREGHSYKSYFTNAKTYTLSNAPTSEKGTGSLEGEIALDLTQPITDELKGKFDVVFNHTTLEHIFELEIAFKNLCDMSKDAVVLVVPTLQHIHFNEGYGDYHRITPMGIYKYFKKNGFTPIVLASNEQAFSPIYCFAIAVRQPEVYKEKIEESLNFNMGEKLFGSGINGEQLKKHIELIDRES